ncbi:MAG: hypothetical protein SGPRY_010554 [Prymnesium sp.]
MCAAACGGEVRRPASEWGRLLEERRSWLLSLPRATRHALPCATYACTLNMPLIGKQSFTLVVLSQSKARIILEGKLSLDQPASYTLSLPSPASHRLALIMQFNRPTLELLSRWRTRIRSVLYDRERDITTLVVAPPLVPPIHVRMRRVRG